MNLDKLYKDKKTLILMLIVVFIGIILMGLADFNIESDKSDLQEDTDCNLESRLEDILSQVKGAGNVKVMLTYKAGSEKIIAYNTDKENEDREEGFSTNEKNEMALAKDSPVVLKEIYPEIEGVLIVAQGGGDTNVKNNLIRASMALLNVDVNKIEVLIMKKET